MKKFNQVYKTILEDIGSNNKLNDLKKKLDKSSEEALESGVEDKTTETELNKVNTGIKKKKLLKTKQAAMTQGA